MQGEWCDLISQLLNSAPVGQRDRVTPFDYRRRPGQRFARSTDNVYKYAAWVTPLRHSASESRGTHPRRERFYFFFEFFYFSSGSWRS